MSRYLIASDFDGTLFDTFYPSPSGIDVREAYRMAIRDILGERGFRLFETQGLDSNSPYELVVSLFKWHNTEDSLYLENSDYRNAVEEAYKELLDNAFNFFNSEARNLSPLIPECKDKSLSWNADEPLTTIAQMVVGRKLQYLLAEIGKDGEDGRWPLPCDGAIEFLRTVSELQKEGISIDTAIISSGHETFIKKTLELWGLEPPTILVTDDDIRPRKYPTEISRRFKPGIFPLALAHYKWLGQQELINEDPIVFRKEAIRTRERMLYVGDDPSKDLLMAHRSNVHFFLHPHTSWQAIADILVNKKDLFDGRPINEIFPKGHLPELEGRRGSPEKG